MTDLIKLGFLVPHLGQSHLASLLINNINQMIHKYSNVDIVVFCENIVQPCQSAHFSVMNIVDAWNYNGNLITTSLSAARKSLRFPNLTKKFFYASSGEWIDNLHLGYEFLAEIYQNPTINLIAYNNDDAKVIENVWNRSTTSVVEDFNIEAFISLVTSVTGGAAHAISSH